MTSRLLTPWWRSRLPGPAEATGSADPTPILDWQAPGLRALQDRLTGTDPVGRLQQAHRIIAAEVRPVYAVEDRQPASVTLARGAGSCSQRLAILEAVARADGVPTRVRGLLVDGRFWYPRFGRLRALVPAEVLLAWPELGIDGRWLSVSELYGSFAALDTSSGFTNTTGETLFDAVARTAVDWDGVTCSPGMSSPCDLSAEVVGDLGRYSSRDALFDAHGQALCGGARWIADPILRRRSAA
ncbi:MAG: hypothetical protein J7518_13515 [Nocardioidaceae bacterium]|nr:hypothetical protein [Nocardioidaceae bacterium]